jgi:hypothetical protein
MECEFIEKCPFYNEKMQNMPFTASRMKDKYCLRDKTICARYQIFSKLGREKVPIDLFPFQIEMVQKIIQSDAT